MKNKTTPRQEKYIASHIKCAGVKSRAAADCGISRDTVNSWFAKDEDFRIAVRAAEEQLYETLLAAAMKRAMEKSDNLLMFLLKSHEPERFDDNIRKAKWLAENNLIDPDKALPKVDNITIQILRKPE